eukprot:363751-Chlamydomonas_euryale.AAC.2
MKRGGLHSWDEGAAVQDAAVQDAAIKDAAVQDAAIKDAAVQLSCVAVVHVAGFQARAERTMRWLSPASRTHTPHGQAHGLEGHGAPGQIAPVRVPKLSLCTATAPHHQGSGSTHRLLLCAPDASDRARLPCNASLPPPRLTCAFALYTAPGSSATQASHPHALLVRSLAPRLTPTTVLALNTVCALPASPEQAPFSNPDIDIDDFESPVAQPVAQRVCDNKVCFGGGGRSACVTTRCALARDYT